MSDFYSSFWHTLRSEALTKLSSGKPCSSENFPVPMPQAPCISTVLPVSRPACFDISEFGPVDRTSTISTPDVVKERKKNFVPLADQTPFSETLVKAIGQKNTSFINGLDDVFLIHDIFVSLIEDEASRQFQAGRQPISKLTALYEDGQLVCQVYCDFRGKVSGTVRGQQVTSWVDAIRIAFNVPVRTATLILGRMLGLNCENLTKSTSRQHSAELAAIGRVDVDIATSFTFGKGEVVRLKHRADIFGHAGQLIGAFILYEGEVSSFCLLTSVARGRLALGESLPSAHWLFEHNFDRYPKASVVMFLDARCAIKGEEILQGYRYYNPSEFFLTSHLGTDLKILPWDYFWGRDVVIVPGPTKYSLASVGAYCKFLEGSGARSIRIHCGCIVHERLAAENIDELTLSAEEQALLRQIVCLDDFESPIRGIESILENAISFDEYITWGKNLGVFKISHQDKTIFSSCDVANTQSTTLTELLNTSPAAKSNLSLEAVFGAMTMLYGVSNIGKSRVLAKMALSLASGEDFLGLDAMQSNHICYINAEYGPEGALNDLRLAGAECLPEACSNIEVFDIPQDKPVVASILECVKRHKSDFLVFDTPQAIFTKMASGQTRELVELFHALKDIGCRIIFSHHTGKDESTHLGSQNLINLTSTVIKIEQNDADRQDLFKRQQANTPAGDYIRATLNLEKWKQGAFRPKLTFSTFQGRWNLVAGSWAQPKRQETAITDEIENNETPSTTTVSETENAIDNEPELTEEERLVFNEATRKGKISTSGVKELLACGDTKAREVLSSLASKKGLECVGQGRGTHYRIAENVIGV